MLLNSDVADRYPQIIKAGLERDWAWLAHGPGVWLATSDEIAGHYARATPA